MCIKIIHINPCPRMVSEATSSNSKLQKNCQTFFHINALSRVVNTILQKHFAEYLILNKRKFCSSKCLPAPEGTDFFLELNKVVDCTEAQHIDTSIVIKWYLHWRFLEVLVWNAATVLSN